MADNLFEIKDLIFAYDKERIIDNLSLTISKGHITTFIGANGCGKSTLFSLMTRNLDWISGRIFFEGEDIEKIKLRELAKRLAIVHQYNSIPFDLSVEKLVGYGRVPYSNHCVPMKSKEDDEKVKWAMEVTGIYHKRKEPVSQLSGGQRQRVWIAMAVAQDTETLLLDEPTTFLDIRHQLEILQLTEKLNSDYGISIIMVLHDMNQALHYSHEIVALKDGKVKAQGEPKDVISRDLIEELYGVKLEIAELAGKPFVLMI